MLPQGIDRDEGLNLADERRKVKVFISYSRHDFHFAEALTAILGSNQVLDPWLDVHRLRPGMDWASSLDEGLKSSDVLVLLASPTAIASTYVQREWRRARERRIPVRIGVIDPVALPAELSNVPVHDLKPSFSKRCGALGDAIAAEGGVPPPGSSWFRLPVPVTATVVLSVLAMLSLMWTLVLLARIDAAAVRLTQNPFGETDWMPGNAMETWGTRHWVGVMFSLLGMTAAAAPLPLALGAASIGLLRRRSGLMALMATYSATVSIGLMLFIGVGMAVGAPPFLDGIDLGPLTGLGLLDEANRHLLAEMFPAPVALIADTAALRLFSIVTVLSAMGAGVLVAFSPTVHLWLPTGLSAVHHRRRITRTRQPRLSFRETKKLADSDPQRVADWAVWDLRFMALWKAYCLRLVALPGTPGSVGVQALIPADRRIEGLLKAACQEARIGDEAASADRVLVLVSSQVPWSEVARAVQEFGSRAIFVLLDSLRLPSDAAELRRYQWLDFRQRHPESLYFMLAGLQSAQLGNVGQQLAPIPIVARRFVAPVAVVTLIYIIRGVVGFFVGFASVRLGFWPSHSVSWILAAATVALVASAFWFSGSIAVRQITPAGYLRNVVLVGVVSAWWAAAAIAILWIPNSVSTPYGVVTYLPASHDRDTVIPIAVALAWFSAIPPLVCTLMYPWFGRLWLPLAVAPSASRPSRFSFGAWTVYTPLVAALGASLGLHVQFLVSYP